jgi:microcin C transport system substrate-binding protein
MRLVYGSAAGQRPGSQNIAGINDPAVDALIETIATAKSRQELTIAARALDRVLRSGHYWVPMWYRASEWLAYWDQFSRPATKPRLSSGAPGTWWYDADKAKRIGRG